MRKSRTGVFLLKYLSWVLFLSDEGRVGLVLWMIVGAMSLNVGTTSFYFLFSGMTGLLMASVLISRWFSLKKVELQIRVPRRTMVGESVNFDIAIKNRGNNQYYSIRIGLPFLPWDGTWINRPATVEKIDAKKIHHTTAIASFRARGEHHLDVFYASALVPLGLATGPIIRSRGTRFLVVPRIAPVVRLETPLTLRYQPGGVALASLTGESRELTGVRPYRPGDSVRDLHAPSWARTGMPVVREYHQEYFTRIGIVVDTDCSNASFEQFEAALSLTAGVVSYLSRGEVLIDLLVIGDDVHQMVLGRSLGFLDQALDLLACVEAGPVLDASSLKARVDPFMDRLSCVVFVSLDWDDDRQQFQTWINARSVGCRTLSIVKKQNDKTPTNTPSFTSLSIEQINASEELAL